MPNKRNKYENYYTARAKIKDIVQKDLLGPVSDDEILNEFPDNYYAMGKLYPETEDLELLETPSGSGVESELDNYDVSLASTNMRNPSSMGITCTLKQNVSQINVTIDFAIYEPMDIKQIRKKEIRLKSNEKDIKEKTIFWVRKFYQYDKKINLNDNQGIELLKNIILIPSTQKVCKNGERIITLALVNRRKTGNDKQDSCANMIFQPHIKITGTGSKKNIFTSTMRQVEIKEDDELLEMDMLYSDYKCYGQGHGCSVNWGNEGKIETHEPDFVESTFIPEYNLKQMKAAQINDLPVLSMKYIISENRDQVISELFIFAKMYKRWIEDQKSKIQTIEKRLQACAQNNINNCVYAYNRICDSITLLKDSIKGDCLIWKAFKYANEAMLMQRIQTLTKQNRKTDEWEIKWYPFQLAFFLQELMSMACPKCKDRELVDLLWFPTGGGKTEAYLGIAAFTIFYRRMKYGEEGEGVAVIMRYTLRLLTIQQFERASILICACELLRRKYKISSEPIEIGLWVGNELTPKDTDIAKKNLEKLLRNESLSSDEANPCQIKVCPWCGAELTESDYSVDKSSGMMNIKCHNIKCDFYQDKGLPVRLTDQEIYEKTPAFMVATVDKFAQITLKSEPRAIFGIGDAHYPPDLIIQDELHLISGPLGTMTGIYEAAITTLCKRNNIPVKIIASTATIRNARNQIHALYGRNYSQFPPQAISADDSFFAVKSEDIDKPARLYLGYMGVGTTFTTTLIRIYAAWLFASRYLIDLGFENEVIDNYWTLTGYFNSLRELGGTRIQIVDDVQGRYQYLRDSKFAHLVPAFTGKDRYDFSVELTSRVDNDEISDIIQKKLKNSFTRKNSMDVYDFILASNMISVGVDVGRLGTMAVAGQPKTNAEYIQATSRVGRDNPGLVFTMYNASRSRDRSHYEQFLKYHSSLYRHVEATSLTPFSDRARDRGLQALFVTLCRYLVDGLLENNQARNFDKNSQGVKQVEKIIEDYVCIVDKAELNNIRMELQEIEDEWEAQAEGKLYYKSRKYKELLKNDTEKTSRFRIMNSMRNVEQQSGIYLLGR